MVKGNDRSKRIAVVILCAVLAAALLPSLALAAATDGLFAGKFDAVTQVFDVQRVVGTAQAAVYSFGLPYTDLGFPFTTADLAGKYFAFVDTDSQNASNHPRVALYLYNGNGTVADCGGKIVNGFVCNGSVAFASDEGVVFISESGSYGYFISNGVGYASGEFPDSGAPFRLSQNLQYDPDLTALRAYSASVTPVGTGKVVLRFHANGDGVTLPQASVTFSANTDYTIASALSPTRADSDFLGWSTQPGGGGAFYAVGSTYNASVGANLYAQWSRDASQTREASDGIRAVITRQPSDCYAVAGQSATFSVSAMGEGLRYQWYRYQSGKHTWEAVDGANRPEYTIGAVTRKNDGNIYNCRIYDANGNGLLTDSVVLRVAGAHALPQTGDASRPLLWAGIGLLSALGAALAVRGKRRV